VTLFLRWNETSSVVHETGVFDMKVYAYIAAATLALSVPTISHASELFNNGPVVGPTGISVFAPPATTFGFGSNTAGGLGVADNFSVTGGGWNVQSLDFFSYQTGAVGFTLTNATWSIVSGDVNTGTVVASGTTTLTNQGLMGYRVLDTAVTDTNRAIYRVNADIADVTLAAGSYYLAWSLAGTGASGPWVPPVLGATGNAFQKTNASAGVFNPLIEAGTGLSPELPFVINGTMMGMPNGGVPEPSTWFMMIAGFGLVGGAMRRRQTALPKIA
jgi:hypothetical protein